MISCCFSNFFHGFLLLDFRLLSLLPNEDAQCMEQISVSRIYFSLTQANLVHLESDLQIINHMQTKQTKFWTVVKLIHQNADF